MMPVSTNSRTFSLTFKPTVSCVEVPDLRIAAADTKRCLWWQADDFAEFLKMRQAITKAYFQAVREKRIDSFTADGESRRGLGLGRERHRLNSTKTYIQTVLAEQARQRRLAIDDPERLAEVARAISAADLKHSIESARKDEVEAHGYTNEAVTPKKVENSGSPRETIDFSMKRVESLGLFNPAVDTDDDEDAAPATPLKAIGKGFGISRQELEQAGLRATGRRDDSINPDA